MPEERWLRKETECMTKKNGPHSPLQKALLSLICPIFCFLLSSCLVDNTIKGTFGSDAGPSGDSGNEGVPTHFAHLSWTPPSMPSNVPAGTSQDLSFNLTNAGSTVATNLVFSGLSGAYSDAGTGTCGTSLNPNSSCTFVVRFTSPGDAGSGIDTTLMLSYHDGSQAQLLTTPLSITGTEQSVSVQAVYPNNDQWLEYVIANNGGSSPYDQPDTSCTGSETGGYFSCIHGGEKRKVTLSGISSCSGLALTDNLNAFNWKCLVVSGNATFYSLGLKSDHGLNDLINASNQWIPNEVTVTNGSTLVATSSASAWWSNPIVDLPDNSSSAVLKLDTTDDDGVGPDQVYTAGTIFTLQTTRNTQGYNINMDRVGVLIKQGAKLVFAGGGECKWDTGEISSPSDTCVVATGSQKFLWFEGEVDGNLASSTPIIFTLSKFSRIHRTRIANFTDTGFFLVTSTNNYVSSMDVQSSSTPKGWGGVRIASSTYNYINDLRLGDFDGVYLVNSSDNNILFNFQIYNSAWDNINLDNSSQNILASSLTASSANTGISLQNNSSGNTFTHVSSMNQSDEGYGINSGSDQNTFVQSIAANNGGGSTYGGFFVGGVSDLLFSNITHSSSATNLLAELFNVTNIRFTHNLLSKLSNCSVSGTNTNPGLDGSCNNQGTSDAHLVTGIDFTNSFFGKVTSDTSNTSHTAGLSSYSLTMDWLSFDNLSRVWGNDGSSFPNADNGNRCSSGNCRIWDWRISSSDTMIRNKSGDGLTANEPFIANSTCPSAVNGNYTLTDLATPPHTFLVNALEIMGDEIGNENGLCESNEACTYSPNFGAYQGEGDYLSNGTCLFVDGTISGVKMYAYPTNGF